MARENVKVTVDGCEVDVKRCSFCDIERFYPEADSVQAVAARTGRPFKEIWNRAQRAAGGGNMV